MPVLASGLRIGPGRPDVAADDRSPSRGDRALIVVGLPGDLEHETLFRETTRVWQQWLAGSLQFPVEGVRVLFGARGEPSLGAGPATRQAITEEAATIRRTLKPEGRLWVFLLGHANESGGHAFLHLPGPDLRDDELGALFKGIAGREQVFWVTTSAAGWVLPALSARGRIVIAATTRDQEFNETEFPHALAEVCRRSPEDLDQDGNGKVSVWELFLKTNQAVEARFQSDGRAPTEHALLDDNGDKLGTERPDPAPENAAPAKTSKREPADGELAKKTFLPLSTR